MKLAQHFRKLALTPNRPLGGGGTIAGPVTIGTGSGTGANIAPSAGKRRLTTLTMQSALQLNADATYTCNLKVQGSNARSDEIAANGITITGATVAINGAASGATPGTSITLINNTSALPISGTFANLSDGGTIIVGATTFRANYEGGDGNDLTLTAQ